MNYPWELGLLNGSGGHSSSRALEHASWLPGRAAGIGSAAAGSTSKTLLSARFSGATWSAAGGLRLFLRACGLNDVVEAHFNFVHHLAYCVLYWLLGDRLKSRERLGLCLLLKNVFKAFFFKGERVEFHKTLQKRRTQIYTIAILVQRKKVLNNGVRQDNDDNELSTKMKRRNRVNTEII